MLDNCISHASLMPYSLCAISLGALVFTPGSFLCARAVVERKGRHIYLRSFKLDTPYGAVIGYIKRLQSTWNRLGTVNCDQTGVGEYIVEDMKRSGIRNVQGTTFTQTTKEAMATALKETMRTAICPRQISTSVSSSVSTANPCPGWSRVAAPTT